MSFNLTAIKDKFATQVTSLHYGVSKNIRLTYVSGYVSTTNEVGLGGTSYLAQSIADPFPNQGEPVTITSEMSGRVYWTTNQTIYKELNLRVEDKVAEVVVLITDVPALVQSEYIEVEVDQGSNIYNRLQMIKTPIPHGLGNSTFATSYWKSLL